MRYTVYVNVRVDAALVKKLDDACRRWGLKRSQVIRSCLARMNLGAPDDPLAELKPVVRERKRA
jgi:hypothetical protein